MQKPFQPIPLSLLVLLTLPACSNSLAEPKSGDRFGDWIYECRAISENKAMCNLAQTIIAKKGNQRILELNILKNPEDDKDASLSVLLPLGIYLPSGVSAAVVSEKNASGKSFALELKTCIQKGCIATTKLDDARLNSMRNGAKLAISFAANPKDKPLVVYSSLKGVTDGLEALGIDE